MLDNSFCYHVWPYIEHLIELVLTELILRLADSVKAEVLLQQIRVRLEYYDSPETRVQVSYILYNSCPTLQTGSHYCFGTRLPDLSTSTVAMLYMGSIGYRNPHQALNNHFKLLFFPVIIILDEYNVYKY